MSIDAEHSPSPRQWVRDQVELYEGIQDGPDTHDLVARELSATEKAQWWARAVTAFPDYADYQARTERETPVFVLEPATT